MALEAIKFSNVFRMLARVFHTREIPGISFHDVVSFNSQFSTLTRNHFFLMELCFIKQ